MRHFIAIIAILPIVLTVAASAQPVIGPEFISDPVPLYAVPAQAALAEDRSGIALVWAGASESIESRIYFARLDASYHALVGVRRLPPVSGEAQAGFPSIAPDPSGEGFRIAWVEWEMSSPTVFGNLFVAPVDRDGTEGKTSLLWSGPAGPTAMRSDGGNPWVTTGPFLTQLDNPDATIRLARPAGDMIVLDQRPRIVSNGADGNSLELLSLDESDLVATLTTSVGASSAPTIATDGKSFLLVWTQQTSDRRTAILGALLDLPVDSSSFSLAALNPIKLGETAGSIARPAIASDGIRYVVVWETENAFFEHDIAGAVITSARTVTSLVLADSSQDERAPNIIATGRGSFVAIYGTAPSHRFAIRTITFPVRRRPTR